jgi:hypothetical protein
LTRFSGVTLQNNKLQSLTPYGRPALTALEQRAKSNANALKKVHGRKEMAGSLGASPCAVPESDLSG